MATEVFTTEEVRLLDGTEVELRPLPIAKMRKFMRIWSEHIKSVQEKLAEAQKNADDEEYEGPVFNESDLTDAQYDVFIKLCALGLSTELQGEKTDKKFAEYLEDVLDEQTIQRILLKTGGLQVGDNDPNQTPPSPADGLN